MRNGERSSYRRMSIVPVDARRNAHFAARASPHDGRLLRLDRSGHVPSWRPYLTCERLDPGVKLAGESGELINASKKGGPRTLNLEPPEPSTFNLQPSTFNLQP